MESRFLQPERVGSRQRARDLFDDVPADVHTIHVEFATRRPAAPSFLDEVIRQALIDRDAAELHLHAIPAVSAKHAQDAADRRGVAYRLVCDVVG